MPTIKLLTVDSSTILNTDNITNQKPTVLFAFETWCPYCKAQMQSIISQIDLMNDINICMVCYTDFSEYKKFYHHNRLDKYSNIISGVDYNMSMAKYFRSTAIPLLAIYDREKNLKQVLMGKTSIKTIKEIALK